MFEETTSISESVTPSIPPLTENPTTITTLVGNTISDAADCRRSILGAKLKTHNRKSAELGKVIVREPQNRIKYSTTNSETTQAGILSKSIYAPNFELEEVIFEQKEFPEELTIKLAEEIRKCWGHHQNRKRAVEMGRAELRDLRSRLSSQLYRYKKHLVRTGRNGGWALFLRERGIPLSTADRYVKEHEISLTLASGKLLTEEIGIRPRKRSRSWSRR
jgi:hypothetical protein